jgi:hypothetical protein
LATSIFLAKGRESVEPVILIGLVNEILREAYGLLFAQHGYRVLTASRVLECLHKVRCAGPEVLLVDEELWCGTEMVLGISGADVAWPPVVLLTPEGSYWRDGVQSLPVVTCLEKPVDFGRLSEEVTRARRIFFYTADGPACGQTMGSNIGVLSAF